MFKFYVMRRSLSIDAGLQLGYMVSAKVSGNGKTVDVYDEGLNKFDASFSWGLSYKLTDKFDLCMRSNFGITKLTDETDHTNYVSQLSIGYRF